MGQWNRRRWWSRKRNFYQEGVPQYHCNFENQIEPSEYEDNIPSWEKQFCKAASVPWGKVLFVRKYMHMHGEILNWNDSSGEEAFNNAKQRFWADINGLPCDICLPDPDMYIENIDWDTSIDPKLIAELDQEFFDVDNAVKAEEKTTTKSSLESKMQTNAQNPWEPTDVADVHVGTSWDNNKPQNPWEPTDVADVHVGTSWDNNKPQNPWEPTDVADDVHVGTRWDNNKPSGLKEEKRWNLDWDSWGQQSNQNSSVMDNNNNNTGRTGREPKSGYNNNNQWENRNKDFGRTNGGSWRPANDNSNRKREWIHQDASRYKTFRFDDRSDNNWRKEREGQIEQQSSTQWRQMSRQ